MNRGTDKFIELMKPHYNDALRYCRALCAGKSTEEAEDVLQQSFLQALEKFHTLNDETKFKSWFFKIITRAFYTSVRKSFWKKFSSLDVLNLPEFPDVYSTVKDNSDPEIINYALSKISNKERTCLLLFEIAGLSIEEIKTAENEMSLSAVKSRLSRARKKLKKIIEEYEAGNNPGSSKIKTNFLEEFNNESLKLAVHPKGEE